MRTLFVSIVFLCAMSCPAWLTAQNKIYIEDQEVEAGATGVEIPIKLDTDSEQSGLSICVQFDETKLEVTGLNRSAITQDASWFDGQIKAGKLQWSIVMDLEPPTIDRSIPAGTGQTVASLVVDVLSTDDDSTVVEPKDGLNDPGDPTEPAGGWRNVISYNGNTIQPSLEGGTITIVGVCPDAGDTRITDLSVDPAGGPPGNFTATATAEDDSGDPIIYTFVAKLDAEEITVGPQSENTADFTLNTEGTWTITATVDDDPDCPDEDPDATRSVDVEVKTPSPVNWKPCDTTGEGNLDLTDVINFLNYAFVGSYSPNCIGALDCDGNGGLDLTDAIASLNYQFVNGVPPGAFPFECKEYTQAADGSGEPCEVGEGCQ